MSQLSICLFGPPTLTLDGRQVMLDRWKAVALLAYLAVEDRPHRRDGLATLLWPELSQAKARNGLRRSLHALKQALGDQWLDASRETVRLRRTPNLTVDVWQFPRCLGGRRARLLHLRHCSRRSHCIVTIFWPSFRCAMRLHLRTGAILRRRSCAGSWPGRRALLRVQRAAGDLGAALQTARRRLALDPLEESAHRTLIELHLAAGDRAAAVRQYEHCAQLLAQELGVTPDAATQALLDSPASKPAAALAVPALGQRRPASLACHTGRTGSVRRLSGARTSGAATAGGACPEPALRPKEDGLRAASLARTRYARWSC